jgi:hypothetical protein
MSARFELAHQLAVLAETAPDADLLIAVRLALEVADARRAHRGAVREASLDVAGGWPRGYADRWVPHEEITRRRTQPGPPGTPGEGAA